MNDRPPEQSRPTPAPRPAETPAPHPVEQPAPRPAENPTQGKGTEAAGPAQGKGNLPDTHTQLQPHGAPPPEGADRNGTRAATPPPANADRPVERAPGEPQAPSSANRPVEQAPGAAPSTATGDRPVPHDVPQPGSAEYRSLVDTGVHALQNPETRAGVWNSFVSTVTREGHAAIDSLASAPAHVVSAATGIPVGEVRQAVTNAQQVIHQVGDRLTEVSQQSASTPGSVAYHFAASYAHAVEGTITSFVYNEAPPMTPAGTPFDPLGTGTALHAAGVPTVCGVPARLLTGVPGVGAIARDSIARADAREAETRRGVQSHGGGAIGAYVNAVVSVDRQFDPLTQAYEHGVPIYQGIAHGDYNTVADHALAFGMAVQQIVSLGRSLRGGGGAANEGANPRPGAIGQGAAEAHPTAVPPAATARGAAAEQLTHPPTTPTAQPAASAPTTSPPAAPVTAPPAPTPAAARLAEPAPTPSAAVHEPIGTAPTQPDLSRPAAAATAAPAAAHEPIGTAPTQPDLSRPPSERPTVPGGTAAPSRPTQVGGFAAPDNPLATPPAPSGAVHEPIGTAPTQPDLSRPAAAATTPASVGSERPTQVGGFAASDTPHTRPTVPAPSGPAQPIETAPTQTDLNRPAAAANAPTQTDLSRPASERPTVPGGIAAPSRPTQVGGFAAPDNPLATPPASSGAAHEPIGTAPTQPDLSRPASAATTPASVGSERPTQVGGFTAPDNPLATPPASSGAAHEPIGTAPTQPDLSRPASAATAAPAARIPSERPTQVGGFAASDTPHTRPTVPAPSGPAQPIETAPTQTDLNRPAAAANAPTQTDLSRPASERPTQVGGFAASDTPHTRPTVPAPSAPVEHEPIGTAPTQPDLSRPPVHTPTIPGGIAAPSRPTLPGVGPGENQPTPAAAREGGPTPVTRTVGVLGAEEANVLRQTYDRTQSNFNGPVQVHGGDGYRAVYDRARRDAIAQGASPSSIPREPPVTGFRTPSGQIHVWDGPTPIPPASRPPDPIPGRSQLVAMPPITREQAASGTPPPGWQAQRDWPTAARDPGPPQRVAMPPITREQAASGTPPPGWQARRDWPTAARDEHLGPEGLQQPTEGTDSTGASNDPPTPPTPPTPPPARPNIPPTRDGRPGLPRTRDGSDE